MKRSFLSLLAISAVCLSLTACSGLPRSGGGGGGGGGSTPANLTLTLSDAPPANTSFVSFTLPINGITLTPVSGADVNVFSPSSTANFEATRLQSDSAQIGTGPFQVAPGTYIALNIFINNSPTAIWVNNSSSTILGCAPAQVCNLSGAAPGKIIINLGATLGGQGLVVTSGQNLAIGLDFSFANAITTSGGIGIDLRQAGSFTAVTLPRTGQATGSVDSIDDFTGTVTAVSGNSITVTSATRGTLTGTANSSTVFNDPTGAAGA